MPGGKLHFLERPSEGAKREVAEETGIQARNLVLISVSNDMTKDSHFITLGFLCTEFSGEAKVMEPDEITQWKWFSLDKLPSPLFKPSEKVVNSYLSKIIYSE